MLNVPRASEVKLVRLSDNAAEETINAHLAAGLVMLQCVGPSNVMVMLRYETPIFESTQQIRLVKLGDYNAEELVNKALQEDFMPMGHVGSGSQFLLMSKMVEQPKAPRRSRAGASGPELVEQFQTDYAAASKDGPPAAVDEEEHDDDCPACNEARLRRDN